MLSLAGLTVVSALTLGSALAATASPDSAEPTAATAATANDCVAETWFWPLGPDRFSVDVLATCTALEPGVEFRAVYDTGSGDNRIVVITDWSSQTNTQISASRTYLGSLWGGPGQLPAQLEFRHVG